MKIVRIILLILITIGIGLIFTRDRWVPKVVEIILFNETSDVVPTETETNSEAISITTVDIKEVNFTGKKPVISGSGLLVSESQKYIRSTMTEFKTRADSEVPDLRRQFGEDNPTANYSIDINAKEIKSAETDSIIISVYTYTGGAHGSSYYKVFNVSVLEDKILFLSDIITGNKQTVFTERVKNELNNWKPDGAVVVFGEEVNGLTFASFKNWTLDDKTLTIYFDQYEIGPGVLGAVGFPISLDKVKDLLN